MILSRRVALGWVWAIDAEGERDRRWYQEEVEPGSMQLDAEVEPLHYLMTVCTGCRLQFQLQWQARMRVEVPGAGVTA